METPLLCVVISSLHTDEGMNGDSTVVLEVTSPEDLEDFSETNGKNRLNTRERSFDALSSLLTL